MKVTFSQSKTYVIPMKCIDAGLQNCHWKNENKVTSWISVKELGNHLCLLVSELFVVFLIIYLPIQRKDCKLGNCKTASSETWKGLKRHFVGKHCNEAKHLLWLVASLIRQILNVFNFKFENCSLRVSISSLMKSLTLIFSITSLEWKFGFVRHDQVT